MYSLNSFIFEKLFCNATIHLLKLSAVKEYWNLLCYYTVYENENICRIWTFYLLSETESISNLKIKTKSSF